MENRVIKFRGMNTDGEWLYGDLIHQDGLSNIVPVDGSAPIEYSFVMAVTVGQYTGLKDKNGKEIYEGDVVLTDEAGWIGHVIYGCDCFMVIDGNGGFSSCCNWEAFEVIGNIYEHPERIPEVTHAD